jgi:PAS domain S-box-containing protein
MRTMHAVFRNLSTGTKLLILCLAFIVALAVPIYGLVQDRLASVDFVGEQLVGSRYLATLRGIYAAVLGSVPNAPSSLRPTASSDEVLKTLADAEQRARAMMRTAELQGSLATTLHELWSSDPARTPTDSFVMDALSVTKDLASRIGEDSNLSFDPNPRSYYLQDVIVLKLPAIMSQLGEEQTLLAAVASAGRFSSERRGRLLIVDGLLRSTVEELRRDVATAYRMDPTDDLKRTLDADVNEMARNVGLYFNAADEQLAEGDARHIELGSLGPLYAAAVERSLKVWALVQGELDRLLTERVAELNIRMLQSLMLTGALGFLSVAIGVMTYRNIVQPLHRLSHVVTQIRQSKDDQLRVHDAGQDEIGQLGAAFNDMLSALSTARHRERRLVDANIIGVYTWQLGEQSSKRIETLIVNANDAFLRMVGYERKELGSGSMSIADLTPPEWRDRTLEAAAELNATGTLQQYEKEYLRKDGSRVPVLIGAARFEGAGNQGVAFVLDLSELKRAEAEASENERRYRDALMRLAHANRITTMGQLTASVAHEISQPIAATVTNAQAGLNWLDARPPNLEEVRQMFDCIISDGMRAGDVVGRIRALIKKAPPQKEAVLINEAVLEVIALTRSEMASNSISVRTQLAEGLPLIQADRVQLQQVMLNLIVNAAEAMSEVSDEARELLIATCSNASNGILVSLRDSGPGLDPTRADQLFDPFYTTKAKGMGMGLAICRSIIEAHGGRMWSGTNEPRGAVFQFTLPLVETAPYDVLARQDS